ncbi:MAG: formate dehydrogenase accessory protein [Flavipsychrobacter sp.]|jgi:FdhD protein|nr:formate dehydrogenase accessory protein [Flavipsychrobacter sp.]
MQQVVRTTIKKVNNGNSTDADDLLAAEEPLEIRLEFTDGSKRTQKSLSVTMRTPGHDFELATGFLYTEGIITSATDIEAINNCKTDNKNIVCISLQNSIKPNIGNLERNFYTTSSCGVCGKASIESVKTVCPIPDSLDSLRIAYTLICQLPDKLRAQQDVFENTGGLHGCALFDLNGNLLLSREDVGRHNALDKLIGAALNLNMLPLDKHILMLSGRASFELVQKAIMAGVKLIAAVGAPSSLAAEMAEERGITLIGFLRGERFNIYSGAERIIV